MIKRYTILTGAIMLGFAALSLAVGVLAYRPTVQVTSYDVPASGEVIDLNDYWAFANAPYSEKFECIDQNTYASRGHVTMTVTGPFMFQPDDGAIWHMMTPPQWYRMDFEKDNVLSYWGPGDDQDLAYYVSDWVYEDASGVGRCVRYSMGWFTCDMTNTLEANNPPASTSGDRTWIGPDWGTQYAGYFPHILSTRYHTVPNSTLYYSYDYYYVSDVGTGNDFLDTPWTHGWTAQGESPTYDSIISWRQTTSWMGWRCYGPYCGNVVRLEHIVSPSVVERWYLMEDRGLVHLDQWKSNAQIQCTVVDICTLDGDTDCDCDVDIVDVIRVLAKQGCAPPDACYDADCDFDSDNDIDATDLAYVKARRGNHCA